jgi:uncharacterized protein (DUF2236 family)
MEPIARKINREAVVLLGWGRAILLQIAHPLVAAAVHDHSDFSQGAGGYVRRVRRTVGGMLSITFGDPGEARAVVERINAIHRRVNGALREPVGMFPSGTPYSAADPHLLLWVHATLVDSMLMAYEQFVGPLTPAERDAFCAEAAETARWFGISGDALPLTTAALADYFDRMYSSGEIVVGADARALAQSLFAPPLGPAVPMFRVTKVLTLGLLPGPIRAQYGFEWDGRRARVFRALASSVRRIRRLLPPLLREWPIARRAA